MLDEYKELCKKAADIVPDWESLSKNDLCRAYVANAGNPSVQNAYLSAILYRYWNLIGKYYYISANCVTEEECYTWLVDSVSCCVSLASWENPESSIYNDPNGPDKVINRCMKCARLTYYQFINRKKRREDFGILSIDEMRELFGNGFNEPSDSDSDYDVSDLIIQDYIIKEFTKKNYFVSFLIYFIVSANVFDVVTSNNEKVAEFNLRKICKVMNNVSDNDLIQFSVDNDLNLEDVKKAFEYIRLIPSSNMRKKIQQTLEQLKRSELVVSLRGGK